MNETTTEAMAEPFAPGNLVRLKQPYRPDDYRPDGPMGLWRKANQDAWRVWPGFTHGIIAEVISRVSGPVFEGYRAGGVTRVSLHLYDPDYALLYIHDRYTVPTYCDFHVKELIPHKIAADEGYATLPDLAG